MALAEQINEQMKAAMKSGEKLRLETLRSIRAAILEFEKSGIGRDMTEEDAQKILISAAKKRQDAIEQYVNVGRSELAEKEQAELEIIREFLPKQLSQAEIEDEIRGIIAATGASGAKDFGKVMGTAAKQMRGKADGALIQQLVKQLLG